MKTKEQIKSEGLCGKCGADVFTLGEFLNEVISGSINEHDGNGYFHDGEKETDISVWADRLTFKQMTKFPYVCWYNK